MREGKEGGWDGCIHSNRFHGLYFSRLGYRGINVQTSILAGDGEYLSQDLRKRAALQLSYLVHVMDVIEENFNRDIASQFARVGLI